MDSSAARLLPKIQSAGSPGAHPPSDPRRGRRPSCLRIGGRIGVRRVSCFLVLYSRVPRKSCFEPVESERVLVVGTAFAAAVHAGGATAGLPGQARLLRLFYRVLSGSTAIQKQKLVAKSVVSVVEGGNAFDGVKQDTRPIIVIDNYDSFTYNLCQYMGEVGANFEVYRNDDITVEEIKKISPRGILISPGPGTPQDSGISLQTVLELGPSIPLFGVCMGLQCIGEAFGGKVVRSPYGVVHGKGSLVHYDEKLDGTLFSGLPNPFQAGRYHSLVIEKDSFPHDALEIVAWTDDGLIMAARHRKYKHIQGVQFHPESIITTEGRLMVKNFIKIIESYEALNCLP